MRVAALLFLALTGCASLIAGNIGTDLSAVRLGTPRAEVEEKLGCHGKTGRDYLGRVAVTYSYKVTDPADRRRAQKYAKFERVTADIGSFGHYSYSSSAGSGSGTIGAVLAAPLLVVEGVLTVRELARAIARESGEVVVVYHNAVVVDYEIRPPPRRSRPPPTEDDIERRWKDVRRGFNRR